MPSRTKVSFLFDIKKAANIDDQTLFYLMQKGLQEIEEEEPKLHGQLSVFTNDILNESSLEFYRGTMNQD
jgi:Fe-S cluster assembly scaffold protein SufB